jgi:hypothetical protein
MKKYAYVLILSLSLFQAENIKPAASMCGYSSATGNYALGTRSLSILSEFNNYISPTNEHPNSTKLTSIFTRLINQLYTTDYLKAEPKAEKGAVINLIRCACQSYCDELEIITNQLKN